MAAVDISKLHILVVEDEGYTRAVITRALKGMGTGKISSAKDGWKALAILQETKWQVDVILLDLQMPRVNGYEFLKKLYDEFEPPISDTPVVVISGHSDKKALDRARGMGIGLFLLKPITAAQVRTRINAAMRPRREFFRIAPERVQSALQLAALEDATPREDVVEDAEDQAALNKARTWRDPFNFHMVDIPPGSILTFSKDPSVTCKVVDHKKIEFEGEVTSLSGSAVTIVQRMGYKWTHVAGPFYWEFEDETLDERRRRMEAED